MSGGEDGERGFNYLLTRLHKDHEKNNGNKEKDQGEDEEVRVSLGGKASFWVNKNDVVVICTPGGGGYGRLE